MQCCPGQREWESYVTECALNKYTHTLMCDEKKKRGFAIFFEYVAAGGEGKKRVCKIATLQLFFIFF